MIGESRSHMGQQKKKKIPNATPDDKKSEKNVTATDGIGKL